VTALSTDAQHQHRHDNATLRRSDELPDLHQVVVVRWGQDIVSGALIPGHRIVAEEAAAQFGVSRTVVREAVRVLESMGLVTVRRRVGITVLPPEQWNVFDLRIIQWRLAGQDRVQHLQWWIELGSATAPRAARLAATHATAEQSGALAAAVMGMSTAARIANLDAYLAHHSNFHRVLLRSSGNPILAGLADTVANALTADTQRSFDAGDHEVIRLHGVVASAIQNWDGVAADAAMRAITATWATNVEAAPLLGGDSRQVPVP
jgi:DNA-binding FadR family transcriptional regulator